jgi:hypothetical protein
MAGVEERVVVRRLKLQRPGIEAVETARNRSRPRASRRARRCYVGARRTRTGRRWLLACLTTCLLMAPMRSCKCRWWPLGFLGAFDLSKRELIA